MPGCRSRPKLHASVVAEDRSASWLLVHFRPLWAWSADRLGGPLPSSRGAEPFVYSSGDGELHGRHSSRDLGRADVLHGSDSYRSPSRRHNRAAPEVERTSP